MLKVHKQSLAEDDLGNIWLYFFETQGESQADKCYDKLIKGMDLLANNPDSGVSCDEIREGYRRFKTITMLCITKSHHPFLRS